MRVFMLGWEFPPFISGGLGTACYGLTKAMDQLNVQVTFVLPKMVHGDYATHVRLLTPRSLAGKKIERQEILETRTVNNYEVPEFRNVKFKSVFSTLEPYSTPEVYQKRIEKLLQQKRTVSVTNVSQQKIVRTEYTDQLEDLADGNYGGDMYSEIHRYANVAADLSVNEDFDVIHAHDWMTFPAGIAASQVSGKPLVVQVHSTEFDRSGEHVNQMIYDAERRGMHAADKIIAVSNLTRGIIINRYGISPEKVDVVHNGVDRNPKSTPSLRVETVPEPKTEKLVLFLGRITMQKGPEYFLRAAKKVLEVMDNVRFVMAGSGDMMQRAVELAAELGIGSKVVFTGFLRGKDVARVYRMADLFVMPSVSEPFGLVPLEALDNEIPVIISKQSGVSEVLTHALKVDFWDTDEMANKIVAVLKYPPLKLTLQNHGNYEVRKLRWKDSALKCMQIYESMLVPA